MQKTAEAAALGSAINFQRQSFEAADWSSLYLNGSIFTGCCLTEINLSSSLLSETGFADTHLWRVIFDKAILHHALFLRAEMISCRCIGTQFPLATLAMGHYREVWCHTSTFIAANLERSTWTNSTLRRCVFTEAKLGGATFIGCDLAHSSFKDAKLEEVTFIGCSLTGVQLTREQMAVASFEHMLHPDVPGLMKHIDQAVSFAEGEEFKRKQREENNEP